MGDEEDWEELIFWLVLLASAGALFWQMPQAMFVGVYVKWRDDHTVISASNGRRLVAISVSLAVVAGLFEMFWRY